jgi:hypothetical protein
MNREACYPKPAVYPQAYALHTAFVLIPGDDHHLSDIDLAMLRRRDAPSLHDLHSLIGERLLVERSRYRRLRRHRREELHSQCQEDSSYEERTQTKTDQPAHRNLLHGRTPDETWLRAVPLA